MNDDRTQRILIGVHAILERLYSVLSPDMRRAAKQLMVAIERECGLTVQPTRREK